MVLCCQKKHQKKFKRFEKKFCHNKIYPLDQELKTIHENELYCSGCKNYVNDLNKFIICGGCEKYFHCKIAGECIGKNCMNPGFDGEIHRTQYCYCCIQLYYGGNKCLCKSCQL